MTEQKTELVYCNVCGALALAKLNDTPFCAQCLFRQISKSHQNVTTQCIQPLFDYSGNNGTDAWPEMPLPDASALNMA